MYFVNSLKRRTQNSCMADHVLGVVILSVIDHRECILVCVRIQMYSLLLVLCGCIEWVYLCMKVSIVIGLQKTNRVFYYIFEKSLIYCKINFKILKKKILYANEVLFHHSLNALRKGWRFQRGNQKLSIKRQHNTQVKETKKWYTKNKDWEKVVWFMVFSVTFNHISVISRLSVSLVEDTWENHLPVGSRWQTWSHNVVSTTPRHGRDSNSQL